MAEPRTLSSTQVAELLAEWDPPPGAPEWGAGSKIAAAPDLAHTVQVLYGVATNLARLVLDEFPSGSLAAIIDTWGNTMVTTEEAEAALREVLGDG